MPVYEYTALNQGGKKVKGIVDADSALAARNKLRSTSIFPIDVRETSTRPKDSQTDRTTFSFALRSISAGEISTITRQLATLIGAGLSLVSSLEAMVAQMPNPLLKRLLAQIKDSVNEGNSLAYSISQYPKYFSKIYINMVKAGEASGSLDLVLERLADFSEHNEALKGKFRAAMVYPVIMLCIGVAALLLLVTFIVPKFVNVFSEMGQALPIPTLIIISASNLLQSFWWLLLLILIVLILAFRQFKKTAKGTFIWDHIKLKLPLLGIVNIKMAMARFTRTLSSLVQSGVPLITSLDIVKNIVNNTHIANAVDNAMDDVQAGKSLATSLSGSKWIPPVVTQMITVGEQSGELEKMLNKVADIYEQEMESQITAMMSLLEPIMILFMTVAVGFIAFAILLPILEMSRIVH